jgi:carboxymethylenebutenolidase
LKFRVGQRARLQAQTEHDPPDPVADLKVPVLWLYGGKVPFVSLGRIATMNAQTWRSWGRLSSIPMPDAGFPDDRPAYNRADAEASWSEATNWLKEHGA